MRTVILHRADKLIGPYEGRVALQDKGVAQGSLIDTPSGEWFAYLFRDFGAVIRLQDRVHGGQQLGWGDALEGVGECLRELRRTDAASLFTMLTTEEVARFITPPPTSVAGFERFIDYANRQRVKISSQS